MRILFSLDGAETKSRIGRANNNSHASDRAKSPEKRRNSGIGASTPAPPCRAGPSAPALTRRRARASLPGRRAKAEWERSAAAMVPKPQPFSLRVPEAAVEDLRARLALSRFPDQAPGEPWAFGADLGAVRELVAYWRDGFDWRAEEARLNGFPQATVALHGIDLHYLHVPGKGPDPCPLLLMHGWPGSVFEFLDIIPRLADPARFGGDPADSFTVVAPSLPGYGLSFKPGQKRFGADEIADCVAHLMHDVLGFPRFAAQGGDWGASVASRLGMVHAEKLLGIHINLLMVKRDPAILSDSEPEERRYREELNAFLKEETGYQWIQGTRPQTLAYGLTDSPAGLAAWILEKFRAWSDCDGDPWSVLDRDRVLANIALYWFTGCINASFWPYYARMHGTWPIPDGRTVEVPTGYAAFPREILRPPRSLAERVYTNIRRWTPMERGGHFAAMEQPDALAREVRAFFRPLREEARR
jgi:microsomal epoxide hydrolase